MLGTRSFSCVLWAAVCVLSLSLNTWAADMTAAELLQSGQQLLVEGKLDEARATLQRVDPVQLTREQRSELQKALQDIRQRQSTPPAPAPEPTPTPTPEPAPAPPPTPEPEPVRPTPAPEPAREVAPAPRPRPSAPDAPPVQPAPGRVLNQPAPAGTPLPEPPPLPPVVTPEPAPAPAPAPAPETPVVEITPAPAPAPSPAPAPAPAPETPVVEVRTDAQTSGEMLLQQASTLRAQQLVAQAEDATKAGQYNLAASLYNQALAFDPNNENARQGAERVRTLLSRDVSGGLVESYTDIWNIRNEQTKARYEEAMTNAEQNRRTGNYARASDDAALARAILDTNRQWLRDAEYQQLATRTADFIAQVETLRIAAEGRRQGMQEREAELEQIELARAAALERERRVQELLLRAAELRKELNYEQSLEVLEQALFWEPNNIAAQAMKEMIQDTIIFRNMKTLSRTKNLEIAQQSVENMEATIPYADLVQYPPDWPQLSALRARGLGGDGVENEAMRATREKLRQPIPIQFDANRLESVIDYLRNITGLNINANWRALESAGIDPGTPVTLNISSIPVEGALDQILDTVGGDLVPLGYMVDEFGVVNISTRDALSRNTQIRSYDIRDLLVQAPNFTEAPEFDLSAISQQSGGGRGGGGGGGQSLFRDEQEEEEGQLTRLELTDQIMNLVRNTVDPDNWRDAGGLVSSMSELNGTLIINTTPSNHQAILALLSQIRETRALQINVEARFLLVDQNYLEEVGLDVDVTIFDPGGDFGPITISQDSNVLADRANTAIPGTFGVPTGGDPNVPGSDIHLRGMRITGSFLSDVQVAFLIRATLANRRTTQLSAPRITFFNGQRAYVLVSTQLAYVSDLDPVVGTRSVAFDPQIGIAQSGVMLDVEGTVSADRRYVTMTARPSLARIVRLRQVAIFAQTQQGGGNNQDDDDDDAIPEFAQGILEAPEIELTTVRTTVSVPDKGTLLLGGQRLLAEVEVEAGVPVLSKIPIVNRLFTNRSTIKDERTLLILMKPTILVQTEKENELFPGLQQSVELFGGAP